MSDLVAPAVGYSDTYGGGYFLKPRSCNWRHLVSCLCLKKVHPPFCQVLLSQTAKYFEKCMSITFEKSTWAGHYIDETLLLSKTFPHLSCHFWPSLLQLERCTTVGLPSLIVFCVRFLVVQASFWLLCSRLFVRGDSLSLTCRFKSMR